MQNLTETFHFIDLRPAGEPMPVEAQIFIQSFRDYHPKSTVMVWTSEMITQIILQGASPAAPFPIPSQFADETDLRAKANIIRYWALYNYGGIYCDTDVICLNDWSQYMAGKSIFISQYQADDGARVSVTNAIMGAMPGHPFFKKVLDCLPGFQVAFWGGSPFDRTGSRLIECVLRTELVPDVVKAAPNLFNPLMVAQRVAGVTPNLQALKESGSLAVHLWSTLGDALEKEKKYPVLAQRMMNALGYSNVVYGKAYNTLPQKANPGGEI